MVKYLVIPALEGLNASLQRINLGDHSICGRLNCYSLKMVQKDKKLVKHLQREYSDEKRAQMHMASSVPLGDLREFSTVRLISNLIATLNTTYNDFDFTSSAPEQFTREKPQTVHDTVNARLAPLTKSQPMLLQTLWKHINATMDLEQCRFYSFSPNEDILTALRPHSLWSVDYFVVNLKRKQLLYLSLHAESHIFERKGSMGYSMEMDLDLVDDAMAWCEEEEMSPNTERRNREKKEKEEKECDDIDVELQHPREEHVHEEQSRRARPLNQLHVESDSNCIRQMPPLERPADM